MTHELILLCRHLLRREEFMSAFDEQLVVIRRQEEIQKELEECGEDMEKMSAILDELDTLSQQVDATPSRGC